jgi:hypothetical protein
MNTNIKNFTHTYTWEEDHREPKRALQGIPGDGRREKPWKRWLDDMQDDLRKTGVNIEK